MKTNELKSMIILMILLFIINMIAGIGCSPVKNIEYVDELANYSAYGCKITDLPDSGHRNFFIGDRNVKSCYRNSGYVIDYTFTDLSSGNQSFFVSISKNFSAVNENYPNKDAFENDYAIIDICDNDFYRQTDINDFKINLRSAVAMLRRQKLSVFVANCHNKSAIAYKQAIEEYVANPFEEFMDGSTAPLTKVYLLNTF